MRALSRAEKSPLIRPTGFSARTDRPSYALRSLGFLPFFSLSLSLARERSRVFDDAGASGKVEFNKERSKGGGWRNFDGRMERVGGRSPLNCDRERERGRVG